jgi:hypothetical protein
MRDGVVVAAERRGEAAEIALDRAEARDRITRHDHAPTLREEEAVERRRRRTVVEERAHLGQHRQRGKPRPVARQRRHLAGDEVVEDGPRARRVAEVGVDEREHEAPEAQGGVRLGLGDDERQSSPRRPCTRRIWKIWPA